MAGVNSINTQSSQPRDLCTLSTVVEEAQGLISIYYDLLLESACWGLDDRQEAAKAQERILALLAAIKPQIDRLESIPIELLKSRHLS